MLKTCEATEVTFTEVLPSVGNSGGQLAVPAINDPEPYKPLSRDEDNFCLAVIEYGGNLAQAYRSVFGRTTAMTARAQALLARPEIRFRIQDLTESVHQGALISLGSHLVELASIRDLAKTQAQLKVALSAERARGEVAGFYAGKMASAPPGPQQLANPMVVIHVGTPQDRDI